MIKLDCVNWEQYQNRYQMCFLGKHTKLPCNETMAMFPKWAWDYRVTINDTIWHSINQKNSISQIVCV